MPDHAAAPGRLTRTITLLTVALGAASFVSALVTALAVAGWEIRPLFGNLALAGLVTGGLSMPVLFFFLQRSRRRRREGPRERNLLQNVIEGTDDSIFVKDLDGRYVLINTAEARGFGRSVEEILGHTDEALFEPELAREIMKHDRQVITSGEVQTYDQDFRHRGGAESRTFHVCKYPWKTSSGRVVGVIGIARDITERRELEQDLRQAQKMDALGTLAGGVAHDFNNILGAILGHTEMAAAKLPDDEPAQRHLGKILKAGNRAKDLVTRILDFSRRREPAREPIALQSVVADALQFMRSTLSGRIEIREWLDVNDLLVRADSTQMYQIVVNLCTNAGQAMPGRGTLDVHLDRAEVAVGQAEHLGVRAGSFVRLEVTDTGHGIPEDVMDRIFDPFFTTKGRGEGTGMGLAVVYGIVAEHEGAVVASSRAGRGATFEVFLPIATEDATPAAPPSAPREVVVRTTPTSL